MLPGAFYTVFPDTGGQLAWRRRNAGISRSSAGFSSVAAATGSGVWFSASALGRSRIDGVLSTGALVSTAGSRRSSKASSCGLLVQSLEILLIRLVRPLPVSGTDSASGSGVGAGGTNPLRRAGMTSAALSETMAGGDVSAVMTDVVSGAVSSAGGASNDGGASMTNLTNTRASSQNIKKILQQEKITDSRT